MSESLSTCPTNELKAAQAAAQIGERVLTIIDTTYGSGLPLWTPGSHPLAYHNGYHARAVAVDTDKLGEAYGLRQQLRAINRAAALSHDKDQLHDSGMNEELSARWYEHELERADAFTPEERYIGWLDIIGTKVITDDNKNITIQQADLLDYPSREAELSAKAVACADLGMIWRPEGPLAGHRYLQELEGANPTQERMIDFQRRQARLLDTYSYPLRKANSLLATHRSDVTQYAQQLLVELEAGNITSLRELIECDETFMRQHTR